MGVSFEYCNHLITVDHYIFSVVLYLDKTLIKKVKGLNNVLKNTLKFEFEIENNNSIEKITVVFKRGLFTNKITLYANDTEIAYKYLV